MQPRTIVTKPAPSCPDCGAKMVLRRPPPGKDWQPFWGCNRFPNCRGKLNIDFETGKPITDDDFIDDTFKKTMFREVRKIRWSEDDEPSYYERYGDEGD